MILKKMFFIENGFYLDFVFPTSGYKGDRYILRFTPKANQRNFSAITEGNESSLTVICSNESKSTRDLL